MEDFEDAFLGAGEGGGQGGGGEVGGGDGVEGDGGEGEEFAEFFDGEGGLPGGVSKSICANRDGGE